MGVVLDSSVLIAGERRRESVREILSRVHAAHGGVDCALSVVTIVELTHGIYRAKNDADRERRRAFSEELRRDMVVHPVTVEIAEVAGRIEGEQVARGVSVAFEDLLIGATALHIGYELATLNLRDFQKIPGLSVVTLRTIDASQKLRPRSLLGQRTFVRRTWRGRWAFSGGPRRMQSGIAGTGS